MSAAGHRLAAVVAACVLVALAALATLLLILTLAGWRLQVVESGSMAPRFPRGSLLLVAPVDPGQVEAGTPLVFEDPDRGQVTHRVVAVVDGPEGRSFETRGDANAAADSTLVPAGAVVGEVRWSLPGLGAPVGWLGHRAIAVPLIGVPALLLVVTEAAAWRRRRRDQPVPSRPVLADS